MQDECANKETGKHSFWILSRRHSRRENQNNVHFFCAENCTRWKEIIIQNVDAQVSRQK